jgi:hypothetical protein
MTHQQAIDGLASERYLLDEMGEIERYEFEAHYFDCSTCAEDVRLGQLIREEARRAGASAPVVTEPVHGARILTRPQWRRPMVLAPWAAAAAVAALASYQSLVTVPALRNVMAPQAIAPVMLRGATRGAAATAVAIAPGQRFVTLAADVMPEPQVRTLHYELVDANRAAVLSGQAPVPSSSAPLMLLIPADELQRAVRYTLIVRSAEQGNAIIGEYEFDVSY